MPELASIEPDAVSAAVADRRSIAFAGTAVVGGRGEGIVVATGSATEFGRIARGLAQTERRRSPLQRELDRLVRILLVVAGGLIVVTVGLGFLRGHPVGANLLAGISAAIAAIPEEPPVLLAVILGLGPYRLLRRGVLVRRLSAEETLGAVDLIITDKTGTLTENRLALRDILTPAGPVRSDGTSGDARAGAACRGGCVASRDRRATGFVHPSAAGGGGRARERRATRRIADLLSAAGPATVGRIR